MQKVYNYYNRPDDDGLKCEDDSLTDQHFKDECDVNKIMERYIKTGCLVDPLIMPRNEGFFGDVSEAPDYLEAQNTIIRAQTAFDALPGQIRKRFNNNPAELIAFMADSKNKDEAKKLGLVQAKDIPIVKEPVEEKK